MKKILSVIFILFLSSCGFKPIFSDKDINFYIGQITNVNNDIISKQIIKSLKPYTLKNDKIEILLKINSKKEENVVSRDNKGDPLIHEIKINTQIKIIKKKEEINLKFNEIFSFNNQKNKFEFSQYKKNIQKNLTDVIFEKLILELQKI